MSDNFKKVVRIGTGKTWGGRTYSIFCKIEMKEGRLSISGVEGPLASGNALGACGQIDIHLRDNQRSITLAPGWTRGMLTCFFDVWKRWHLNDMKAGTPAQQAELEKHKFPGYPLSYYTWACEVLEAASLQPDNGYSYGSKWLKEEVPETTIAFLRSLPDTDKQPAWI